MQRVRKRQAGKLLRRDIAEALHNNLRLCGRFFRKRVGKDQLLARLRAEVVLSCGYLVQPVGDAWRISDGAVAGDRPGRGRPDDHMAASKRAGRVVHRELHPDRVAFVVLILDLGFGQRGALDHRPHHRLGATVKLVGRREFQQFAGDARFRVIGHGGVGVVEIADDAEALELVALHLDPLFGIGAAFLAERHHGGRLRKVGLRLALGAIILFLDLPLDRQAVAIPTGHIVRVETTHLEGTDDDVLEDLVQRMADMDVAVGVGRAVMQHVFWTPGGGFAQALVEVHVLPALDQRRFLFRQAGAHREFRLRQIKGLGIVEGFSFVVHRSAICVARRRRASGVELACSGKSARVPHAKSPGGSDDLKPSGTPGQ